MGIDISLPLAPEAERADWRQKLNAQRADWRQKLNALKDPNTNYTNSEKKKNADNRLGPNSRPTAYRGQ